MKVENSTHGGVEESNEIHEFLTFISDLNFQLIVGKLFLLIDILKRPNLFLPRPDLLLIFLMDS